jgi:predicted nucleotidyltransferase
LPPAGGGATIPRVRDEYAPYVEAWRKREREAEQRRHERERLAHEAARAAAKRLFLLGARRVVLFGSLVIEGHFREESDIDLLVEGIAPERLEEVEAELRRALPAFAFDVVPQECASRYLLEWVGLHGIELHAAS